MPRHAKKVSALQERNHHHLSIKYTDFTVYDYARNSKPLKAWNTEVKQIQGQSAVEQCELVSTVPDDWSESTGDDHNQLSLLGKSGNGVGSQAHGCPMKSVAHSDLTGNVYPVDLWFLVSKYVLPEDVSLFARICRGTHIVVHSARFWLGIYRRYCCSSPSLPSALQPDCVEKSVHGLRTRVVRALFHAYPPLSSRVGHRTSTTSSAGSVGSSQLSSPDSLVGLRCVMSWYEPVDKRQQWRFFFRFERGRGKAAAGSQHSTVCPLSPRRHGDADHLLAPDDVMYNADERSVLLLVVTTHFISLPVVMGLVLVKAALSTDGLFARRLRLVFCNEYVHAGRGFAVPSGAVAAEIDPLTSISVMHWWDSGFPVRR